MSRATNRRARDETYRRLGEAAVLTTTTGETVAATVLFASADREIERGGVGVLVDRTTARVRVAELETAGVEIKTLAGIILPGGRRYDLDPAAFPWRLSDDEVVVPLVRSAAS